MHRYSLIEYLSIDCSQANLLMLPILPSDSRAMHIALTFLNLSRDSSLADWLMLPCSSAAGGNPARPNRILAL